MKPPAPRHFTKLGLSTLIFTVGGALSSGLQAQTIYKCGNTYSQVACPDAKPIQVDDKREPEQKQQTDAATQRDAKLAKSLEMERLAQEKSTQRATKPKRKASSTAKSKKDATEDKPLTKITPKRPHSKTAKPDGFVAQVPASGPKSVVKK
jgi:hypothetical protein